jgi:hypothetical protein
VISQINNIQLQTYLCFMRFKTFAAAYCNKFFSGSQPRQITYVIWRGWEPEKSLLQYLCLLENLNKDY